LEIILCAGNVLVDGYGTNEEEKQDHYDRTIAC